MYLFPYDPAWPAQYLLQAQQIGAACNGDIALHHIGSTAVAGLYAKDCIDVLGVVEHIEQVQRFVTPLTVTGFEYRAAYGIEGREYFVKSSPKVHLHIYQKGNCNIARQLGFVRLMQARPDLVAKLNQLKLQLVAKHPTDKAQYQLEKAAFYQEIIQLLESA
jgi:GrpB-like predicted nucleotidyltransferase (UPF0157 family)